ncbi:MAG: PHP domain-containing protein, partial [Anaerolineae bacterium]|nr:PHP domain-containing protein [Anaerolineae bacterium]
MTTPAHLHVHSQYTLLGSTASIEDLVDRAAGDGMRCLALTDTCALYGAVAFAKQCHEVGIQPIVGMAMTVALPQDLWLPHDLRLPQGSRPLVA